MQNAPKRWPNKQDSIIKVIWEFLSLELQGLAKWKEKVGTIFVALASQTEVEVLELHLARTRNDNREFAVQYGWNLLRKYLLKQARTK